MIKIKDILDITFWRFMLVGCINTLFGTVIMFVFYNLFHFNYWISSASNYFFGSILSYFLNKYFTFKSKTITFKNVLLFSINISVCYLISYGLSRPMARYIFLTVNTQISDNISMLIGMGLFVITNYLGQRFIVFKK